MPSTNWARTTISKAKAIPRAPAKNSLAATAMADAATTTANHRCKNWTVTGLSTALDHTGESRSTSLGTHWPFMAGQVL